MAVAIDATGTEGLTAVGVTNLTGLAGGNYKGLTVGAGLSNGAILVFLQFDANVSALSLTWGAQTLTRIGTGITVVLNGGGTVRAELFGGVAPTSGNQALAASWTTAAQCAVAAISVSGANQTGGTTTFAHSNTATSTGSNLVSVAVTSATGNMVGASCVTGNGLSGTPWTAPATSIYADSTPPNISASAARSAGAASVTMQANFSGNVNNNAVIGVDIVAAATAAAPFQLYDFPNPSPPRGALENRGFLHSAETKLIGKDKFFGGAGQTKTYDWPNPRGPAFPMEDRGFLRSVQTQLIGKDKFFGGAGQTQTYDWPNPRGPAFPMENRGFLNQTDTKLIGLDKFFGGPGQAPANLDWPVPKGYQPGIVTNRSHLDSFKLELIGKDQFFGGSGQAPANLDWPVPKGYQPGIITNRSHLDSFKLELIGQDQFFGAAGQAPTYYWANPISRSTSPPQDSPPNLLTTLLSLIAPFAQYLWPNPAGKDFPVAERTHLNLLQAQLIGQDTFFGAPGQGPSYDWPNPIGRGATPPQTPPQNLLSTLLSSLIAPFMQLFWPNPTGKPPLPGGHLNIVQTQLIGQDTFFGDAGMGPTYDWPTPKGYQPGIITNRSHLESFKLELIGQDTFFGAPGQGPNYDWPNPVLRPADTASRHGWFINLLQSTLGIIVYPFAFFDWIVPRGREHPIALRTHTDPLKTNLQGKDQFFGAPGQVPTYDWPNPTLRKDDVGRRSWLGNLLQSTLSIVFSPFSFLGWTVPRGAKLNQPQDQPPNIVLNAPTPPTPTDTPWSGFTANIGRLMGRRG